jgi:hypothetical protein
MTTYDVSMKLNGGSEYRFTVEASDDDAAAELVKAEAGMLTRPPQEVSITPRREVRQ